MVSIRKAQTGKRLYKMGATQSPNRGPVSAQGAQGYRKRDMRNKQPFQNQGRPVVPPRPPGSGSGPVRGGKRPGKGFRPPGTKPGGRPPANGPRPVVSPMSQDTTRPPNPFQQIPTHQDTSQQDTANIPQVGINLPGGGHTLPPPQPPGTHLPGGGHLPQPPGINLPGGGHPPPVGVFGGGTGPYNPNPNGMIGGGGPPGMHGGQTNVTKPGIDPGTGGPIMPYGNMQQAFNGRRPPPGSPNGPRPPGQSNGNGPWGGTPPTPQQVPQVQVTPDGQLQLPYNQQFAMDQFGAVSDANNQLLALQQAAGDQGLQFAQGQRDIGQQYQQAQGQTLNSNASGGTAFSSAYGTQATNDATQYANQMGDLQGQNAAFQNAQAAQRAAIQNDLNMQLQLMAQGYGNQLGGLAGQLGFGQAVPAPVNVNPGGRRGPMPNPPRNRRRGNKKRGRR